MLIFSYIFLLFFISMKQFTTRCHVQIKLAVNKIEKKRLLQSEQSESVRACRGV